MKFNLLLALLCTAHICNAQEIDLSKKACVESLITNAQLASSACEQWGDGLKSNPGARLPADVRDASLANLQLGRTQTDAAQVLRHYGLAWDLAQIAATPPLVALIGDEYAALLVRQQKNEKALAVLQPALKAAGAAAGKVQADPVGLSLLISYASALRQSKRFTEAKPIYRVLAERFQNDKTRQPLYASLLNDLAICMEKTGQVAEAGAVYANASMLAAKHGGPNATQIQGNHESYVKVYGQVAAPVNSIVSIEGAGIQLPQGVPLR